MYCLPQTVSSTFKKNSKKISWVLNKASSCFALTLLPRLSPCLKAKLDSPFMNNFLKKTVRLLGILLIIMVLAAIVIAAFFQDAVGKKLITELNKQFTTELTVGEFDLSLLKGFPNATATFRDVSLDGTFDDKLLETDEMSFHFRLLSLFGSQVKVHSVKIRDGALNLHIDKKGQANYHVLQPSETESESNFNLSLKKANLENIELIFRDEKLRQEMKMNVNEAELAGKFSNKKYDLTSTASLVSNFVDLDDTRYLAGKSWGYDAKILVDLENGTYDFHDVKVKLEGNTFVLGGSLSQGEGYTDFDLAANTEESDLESVINLLPSQYLDLIGEFSSRGKFEFYTEIIGRLSERDRPKIEAQLSLDDGNLTHPKLREPFKDVSFSAVFSNGVNNSTRTSTFEVKDFKGYLNRELMTMTLKVEDLDNPLIDLTADGALPMEYIYELFDSPAITDGDGEIEFKNLFVSGYYEDMLSTNTILDVEMGGAVGFDDAMLKINGQKMFIDRGGLGFKDNLLALDGLKIEGAGGEINLTGTVRNLLPVLFADSLNSRDAKLIFQGEMDIPKINLEQLVHLADIAVEEDDLEPGVLDSLTAKGFVKRERFTDFLQGNFSAKIGEYTYGKIRGEEFSGRLEFKHGEMKVKGRTKAMDGLFTLEGLVFFEKAPRLQAKIAGNKIDLKKFFYQSENFGQDFIRSEHLEGTLNTKMLIQAFWDETGTFLTDDLRAWAGLGVQDGELKGFKLLEEFSDYADVRDLRHVAFTDMQNWVEIKNSKVTLPVMFLQNNAMNLTVNGEQTFDDKIDYGIKVNAGQVLTNKFRRGNSKLKPIKAKKDGFFNLYFNVYGDLEEFEYETNKRKVKNMFARSEKVKKEIRRVLIREFGAPLNMLREPVEWGDEGEVAEWKDDEEDEYIDGFE